MARILINHEWYDELSSTALYETDFENIVTDQAPMIFPDYFVSPFKVQVFTDDDIVIPDLALIDKDYRGWWVVEIEMSYHSFESHILPQVSKLSRGSYGVTQADYLYSHLSGLDKGKVYDMMKGKQPQVLVIVNNPMPNWSIILTRLNTLLSVVEVFRSDKNKYVFRVNGEYPIISRDFVTDCAYDSLLPRFIVIQSPASLGIPNRGQLRIQYENCITEWVRIDGQDRVWLSPISLNPLPKEKIFSIYRANDGSLMFSKKRKPGE
jgi:hypothetical protein